MKLAASWSYYNPVRLTFERGAINRLSEHVVYERVALVTSAGFRRRGVASRIEEALGGRVVAIVDDVSPNPDLADVDVQARRLRAVRADSLIALGGGSSIDTAKALARVLAQHEDVRLTKHFRDGEPMENVPALPLVAIPTTSGTGAEVTPFGTIWDFEADRKYSITGDDLYPRLAILDPELTAQLPEDVTVSSGLDAISHALESAWNRSASPITLGLVAKSLRLSLEALPRAKAHGDDLQAREDMMLASTLAGLAISQTRTALAHSISYPLTTVFDLPHGLACSFTLPALLEFNAEADDGRLARLSDDLGYGSTSELSRGLNDLFDRLEVGRYLATHLQDRQSVLALSHRMISPDRAGNNLRDASREDVDAIVGRALDTLGV